MSAAPRFPQDIGYAGLRMTADQYLSLGETKDRYELIDGVVVTSPSPTPVHQKMVRMLMRQLESWADSSPETEIFADIDLRLDGGRVYRPDVLVFRPGRLGKLPARLSTPPDLIVEILSPTSKPFDLITKCDDYDAFGVGEYWVIDPVDASIRCWHRQQAGTVPKLFEWIAAGPTVPSAALPGFTLSLAPIQAVARQVEPE